MYLAWECNEPQPSWTSCLLFRVWDLVLRLLTASSVSSLHYDSASLLRFGADNLMQVLDVL